MNQCVASLVPSLSRMPEQDSIYPVASSDDIVQGILGQQSHPGRIDRVRETLSVVKRFEQGAECLTSKISPLTSRTMKRRMHTSSCPLFVFFEPDSEPTWSGCLWCLVDPICDSGCCCRSVTGSYAITSVNEIKDHQAKKIHPHGRRSIGFRSC